MSKVVIFGITGQDGFYLEKILKENNIEYIGISRSSPLYIQGNVSNLEFVKAIVKEYKPLYLFNFAANSTTSHMVLWENFETIDRGSLNILESCREFSPSTKVFLSGSAMQFQNDGNPINELTPFLASSPYATSRINTTYLGRYFREKFDMKIYFGYFFHHDSPLRTDKHINKIVTDAVIKISKGDQELLQIGNLDVEKEFNFAPDMMRAIWLLVNQDNFYEAVIGSGYAYKIRDWVEACFMYFNLDYKNFVVTDSNYKPDFQRLVSNPAIIKSLGWQPKYKMEELAQIMINNNLDKY